MARKIRRNLRKIKNLIPGTAEAKLRRYGAEKAELQTDKTLTEAQLNVAKANVEASKHFRAVKIGKVRRTNAELDAIKKRTKFVEAKEDYHQKKKDYKDAKRAAKGTP